MLQEINKDDTLLIFNSVRFPKLRYSLKYFAQIYRDEHLRSTRTLRLENSVNIWSLLWLSRRLIICTEQTSIYISIYIHKKHRSEFIGNYLFNKHCSSFKKLEVLLKHTDKQKFPRNTNFNQSSLFSKKQYHLQGGMKLTNDLPAKLCYSFPFNPQKVIKHCVVPEYVHIPPQNALEIPEGGSGLKGQKL